MFGLISIQNYNPRQFLINTENMWKAHIFGYDSWEEFSPIFKFWSSMGTVS